MNAKVPQDTTDGMLDFFQEMNLFHIYTRHPDRTAVLGGSGGISWFMQKGGYIYIMTTQKNSVLYIGVTSDIAVRDYKHKTKFYENSFTKKYNVDKLVYYERYDFIEDAIKREKQLKNWRREKKINLIKSINQFGI